MKNRILITLVVCAFSSLAHAHISPVISIGAGIDSTQVSQHENILLLAPFYNTYTNSSRNNSYVGSLFVGGEIELYPHWLLQLGFSYYQNQNLGVDGQVWQFGDPNFNNIAYHYTIQSQRFLFETKLLATYHAFHPYLVAGVGRAINKSTDYSETPLASFVVPVSTNFASHTINNFSYLLGLGVDYDVTPHIRIGGTYRYVHLGKARLGTSPLQEDATVLSNQLNTNELLFQLTYVA